MAVKVGLVGTGTVGGGCLDILRNHKEEFKRHFGIDIELTRVCSRQPEVAEAYGLGDIFTTDFHEVMKILRLIWLSNSLAVLLPWQR